MKSHMTTRACAALLLAAALLTHLVAASGKEDNPSTPRVRREIRSLTNEQFTALLMGLSTLSTVPTDAGRRLWGPRYISYPELICKHATAVADPRGDQGHASPAFMTFHRAWLLELEEALLAVAPALGALPYWDITLDSPGGLYHNTSDVFLGPKYAGCIDGDASADYSVTTGALGATPVPLLTPDLKKCYPLVTGNAAGQLRSANNLNTAPMVTRFPTQAFLDANTAANEANTSWLVHGAMVDTAEFEETFLEPRGTACAGWGPNYPSANFERCLDPDQYTSWMEWQMCTDLASSVKSDLTPEEQQQYSGSQAGSTELLHPGIHWIVGSVGSADASAQKDRLEGDFFDVATSPNELLLFSAHHANVDRSAMIWQARAAATNSSAVAMSWGFPALRDEWPTAPDGCLLPDVINAAAPFTTLFATPPANATGYTHRELLALTVPAQLPGGTSPYTYDNLER